MKRLLAALCLICLAGCSSPMPATPEDLLDAPKLSEGQYQVDKALRDQVGQDIKLKYPQSGSYRSAFTFHDIDGDGQEEAIVLHSPRSGGNAQITVMDPAGDQWMVEKTYPGLSPDVDFIRFDSLGSSDSETIVIGWRPEGGQKIVAVYRYQDRDLTMLGSEDYTQLAIGDYNGDGRGELLLVTTESGSRPSLLYMGERDGRLEVLDRITLSRDIVSFQAPVFGQIAPGVTGVALDACNDQGELCTILAQVIDDQLFLPLSAEDDLLFLQTVRSGGEASVFSQDVTGDGIIDIPTEWSPPGQRPAGAGEPPGLHQLRGPGAGGVFHRAAGLCGPGGGVPAGDAGPLVHRRRIGDRQPPARQRRDHLLPAGRGRRGQPQPGTAAAPGGRPPVPAPAVQRRGLLPGGQAGRL